MSAGRAYVQGPSEVPRKHTIAPMLVYRCANCGKDLERIDIGPNRTTYKHRDAK